MKKITLLIAGICFALTTYAGNGDTLRALYAGISFNHLTICQELTSYTTNNWIDGVSQGFSEWTDAEIDELNEYIDIKQIWTAAGISAGGDILRKAGSPFKLSANVGIGYPVFEHSEKQKVNDSLAFKSKQTGMNIYGHIDFQLSYCFKKWSIMATPSFNFLSVNSDDVNYAYLSEGAYHTNYDFKNTSFLPRLDLTAAYHLKNIQVFAGPGFYYYSCNIELDINKTSETQVFKNEIKQEFKSKGNFDAVIGFNWDLTKRIFWKTFARIGSDTNLSTGFYYQF